MTTQPTALRLADDLEDACLPTFIAEEAAAELRRLAGVEAERDALREILNHIPQVEAELAETSDKLHSMTVERDALRAALDKYRGQLDRFGVHSAADAIDAAMKGGGNG